MEARSRSRARWSASRHSVRHGARGSAPAQSRSPTPSTQNPLGKMAPAAAQGLPRLPDQVCARMAPQSVPWCSCIRASIRAMRGLRQHFGKASNGGACDTGPELRRRWLRPLPAFRGHHHLLPAGGRLRQARPMESRCTPPQVFRPPPRHLRGAHRLARRWRGKLSTSSVDVVHSPCMDCVVVGHKGTFPSHTLSSPQAPHLYHQYPYRVYQVRGDTTASVHARAHSSGHALPSAPHSYVELRAFIVPAGVPLFLHVHPITESSSVCGEIKLGRSLSPIAHPAASIR